MAQTRIIPSKPALILEGRKKSLIVTDIHIGFEDGMAANRIFVGKNSTTKETAEEISEIIDAENPDSLILLGDVKSSIGGISKSECNEIPAFFEQISKKCDITLVPGNHDAEIHRLIPDSVSMSGPSGVVEENILLTHGHAMPSENYSHVDKIVMGHIHPVFFQEGSIMNGQRVWVSIRTEKRRMFPSRSGDLEIIIVPSFNRYFYATHQRRHKRSISPIIDRIGDVSSARIAMLDGTIIGNESAIDQVI